MKRALISVSDKTNVCSFAKELVELGYEIISTGGTKRLLDENNIKTISIDEVTNFPEMLDGRVKTLHPNIHGGLLAIRDNEEHANKVKEHNIEYIDLVVVNLYPFKETITKSDFTHNEAIENIDIGGPSMLRSAAKNHKFVTVVCDKEDYEVVIEEIKNNGNTNLETREKLAAKVFRHTASYDAMIAEYFTDYVKCETPEKMTITYDLKQNLRYGENPHQQASFYQSFKDTSYSLVNANQLHGKELSFNNIQDTNAALQILKEYHRKIAVVAVKHMNPCGIGVGCNIVEAWDRAYDSDPISIFGGIVAINNEVTKELAEKMNALFLEVIIAPSYSADALDVLMKKKNVRLLTTNMEKDDKKQKQYISVNGGLLVQELDSCGIEDCEINVVTKRVPSEKELQDLIFGWKAVKHVKSNAIVISKDNQTVGIGAGQMNRVGAAKIALEQAKDKANGAIMASDAFFPMKDTVELAINHGITAIIQPGGSIRDQESIDACNEANIAMIFTGVRHFKH